MSLEYQRLIAGVDMKLGAKELKDFVVPLRILRIYGNAIRELGPKLQDILLNALGIDVNDDGDKITISWD